MSRSKNRKIADLISGGTFDDGVVAASEVTGLHTVAVSGNFNELANKPTPFDPATLAGVAVSGSFNDLADQPAPFDPSTLATVATTGAYSALSGTPALGTASTQAAGAFATAAQGALASTALQPNGDGSALTGIEGTPAGVVIYHAANTPPTGFIKANGASLSTTTYADLFAVIGYTFGGSGGSFNIPDLRGEFLRAWDDSRGIDSGRSFGSSQSEDFGSHDHNMFYNAMSGYTGSWTNPGPTDAVFVHTYGASDFAYRMMSAGNSSSYVPTRGATSDTGGTETRPRNVALLACIKY